MNDPLDRAFAYLDANRPAEAARAAAEAVSLDPQNAVAFRVLGAALHDTDRFDEALAAVQRACALAPTDAVAHRIRAMCHLERGEPWLARPAIEESLRLNPHAARSYAVLSDTEIASGDGDKAQEAAERVLALDPHGTLGHFQLGRVALARHRKREAEQAFERVLAINPHDTGAMHNLALARGDTVESTRLLAQVVRLDPRSAVTVHVLEKRLWGTVVAWLVGTWFLFFVVLAATDGMDAAPAVALRLLAPVVTTALFVRHLLRLPEGARRHLTSRLRRVLPRGRWVWPAVAVLAVGFTVRETRPLAWTALLWGAFGTWVARAMAAERRELQRHKPVVGPVQPESFAPGRLRVCAAVVDTLVLMLLGTVTGPLGALALAGAARVAGSDHDVWFVTGSVLALAATAVAHRLVATRRRGVTYGQRTANVAVVDIWTGEALEPRRLLRRLGWWLVSWLTLGAAFFPAWRGRPTLADRRTHSAVVRRGRPTV